MIKRYLISVAIVIVSFIFTNVSSSMKTASIYRILPSTDEQLAVLLNLTARINETSYWSIPTRVNVTADLIVAGNENKEFKTLMRKNKFRYKTLVADVQEFLHDASENSEANKMKEAEIRRQFHQPAISDNNLNWRRFHNLSKIYSWLDYLAQTYSYKVKTIIAGRSYEGREIKGVHIKFGENRPGVFIEAGIHAREWLTHSTATYLINQLLKSGNAQIRRMAESFDWYIFPCVNPDGYVYTHIDPQNADYRFWRKNRSPRIVKKCAADGSVCYQKTCYGTDLNRNWNVSWGGASSVDNACDEQFAGTRAFSEFETQALAQYISSIANKLFAYISFHSYIQKLMIPYGFTDEHPDNYNEQYNAGLEAVYALHRRFGKRFEVGSVSEVLGPVSGSSVDWVKATHKIPFVYCYELRGRTNNNKFYGFAPPPSEIVHNGMEVMDSLVALFQAANKNN